MQFSCPIIAYRRLEGNYNTCFLGLAIAIIIAYRRLEGNYNSRPNNVIPTVIIAYRRLEGNYNVFGGGASLLFDYSIPET